MSSSVTVAFVTSTLGVGGAERILSELVLRLDRRRFAPKVVCLYGAGAVGEQLSAQGVTVVSGLMRHRWDVRVLWRLTRWLRRERVTILYTINQPLVQGWVSLCRLLARVPVYITAVHSTEKTGRAKRWRWINRLTLATATRVIALSDTHRRHLIAQQHMRARQLVVIPNGVDVAAFASAPPSPDIKSPLGIPADSPVVGIVATLRPEKAHHIFLESARLLRQQFPDVHFVVIGDGPQRLALQAQAARLGFDGRLHWLGLRRDVPALLPMLDIGVLSSGSIETAPLVVLEYMAAGKPVVATRVGSVPELVEDGVTGFLVPPGRPDALADRIAQLLAQPLVARQFGAAGRERVRLKYTLAQTVCFTEALFDRVTTPQHVAEGSS